MRVLEFDVNGQNISKSKNCDFSGLVPGTKGYLSARFNLSHEWSGCKIAASFFSDGKEYAELLKNGICEIPSDALAKNRFGVQITGMKPGYCIKSGRVYVKQEV